MLKLKADPTFTAPVKIPTPNGQVVVRMDFKHMPKDEFEAFVKSERERDEKRPDADVILDIVAGWHDVDGEFNRENVTRLCQEYHAAGRVIVETFVEELTQHRQGN